jgi:transposase
MKNIKKGGVLWLNREFGTEAQCLKVIFEANHSYECSCGGTYSRLQGRRQYQCSNCRHQIAPTAGTIFHKSDTPLTMWFFAIFLFGNAKSGYSASKLQVDLQVTYKTAWRMLKLIRQALPQDTDKLSGDVETDAAYFGGRKSAGENNKNISEAILAKSVVLGAIERGGRVRLKVVSKAGADEQHEFLRDNVEWSTKNLMTDKAKAYVNAAYGYNRSSVDHSRREWARGNVHTNTMEGFWNHVKTSIRGTHKTISKKYLPSYLDAFAWSYNQRKDTLRFSSLLGAILLASK